MKRKSHARLLRALCAESACRFLAETVLINLSTPPSRTVWAKIDPGRIVIRLMPAILMSRAFHSRRSLHLNRRGGGGDLRGHGLARCLQSSVLLLDVIRRENFAG